jgi:hypothetical protein
MGAGRRGRDQPEAISRYGRRDNDSQQIVRIMLRRTPLAAVVAVVPLALLGCGNGDDGATAPEATAPLTVPAFDDVPIPQDDVPEGVAATVDSTEIEIDTVERIYDEISASPAIAEQLEGDDGAMGSAVLRAQVVTQLVVTEIVQRGAAEDFGIQISSADLDAALADVEAEAQAQGGLDAALEGAGLTREVFVQLELPIIALLDQLEDEFGELSADPGAEPGVTPEGQVDLQAWGSAKFAEADVAVSSEYGVWNPQTGQVEPAGSPAANPSDE